MNSVENDYTMRKNRYLQVPLSMKSEIEKLYEGFPPMSLSGVIRICLMLHRAVTGETVQQDQIAFPLRSSKEPLQPSHCETVAKGRSKDRMVNYMAQDAVLQNIRDGNLNYHEDYNRLVHIGTGTKVETENAIERGKLSVVSFISLCMQAAIQGGVLPDVAYSRGDMYTQEVLRAKTYGDLVDVSHTMYEDLLLCVHELHVNKQVSPTIQACCNYIREYVDTDLSIRSLADRLGYSEYYLSRKFSKEMGVSISYYIRAAKVERAKVLLRCTSDSIEKISDDLFFARGIILPIASTVLSICPPMSTEKVSEAIRRCEILPFTFTKSTRSCVQCAQGRVLFVGERCIVLWVCYTKSSHFQLSYQIIEFLPIECVSEGGVM